MSFQTRAKWSLGTALLIATLHLTGCANINSPRDLVAGPSAKEMPHDLRSMYDRIAIGKTTKSQMFEIVGRGPDSSDSDNSLLYRHEVSANVFNPLVVYGSLLTGSLGVVIDCKVQFSRGDVAVSKTCIAKSDGLTTQGRPTVVYQVASAAAPSASAKPSADQFSQLSSQQKSAKPKANLPKCGPGEDLLIISSIKKQKDGTITFFYKGTQGTGNIPPNAGKYYTEAQAKKVGDGICSDPSV